MQTNIERLRIKPRPRTPNLSLEAMGRAAQPNVPMTPDDIGRVDEIALRAAGFEVGPDGAVRDMPPTPLLLRIALTAGIVLVLIGLAVLIWTEVGR